MKIEPIITKRLIIRNYEKSDMEFAMSIWNNPEMNQYLPDPNYEDIDEKYRRALETLQDYEPCCYLIAESKQNGEKIGTCSFIPSEDGCTYDLGCCVHKKYWNQGYATEMEQGMIDHARSQGCKRITLPVNKENGPSNAVARKLGFIVAGEKTCKKYGTGDLNEEYVYELVLP